MVIDAHQHIWDPTRGDYGWLTPDLAPLYRSYLPSDIEPLMRTCAVDGAVWVQAAPTEAETEWLLALAARTPWVFGVVGWLDLDAPDIVERVRTQAKNRLFLGIRPMLQDQTDATWILQDAYDPVFAALAEHRLTFDGLVTCEQLPLLIELVRRHPDVTFVLDHGGKPAVTPAGPDADWARQIEVLGRQKNVSCKFSGLVGDSAPGADQTVFRPYVELLLSSFGIERLLWGSDWPVLNLISDYATWLRLAQSLVPSAAHDVIFGHNAARVYRIGRLSRP